MSIASEISRISNNVQNTIDAIEAAGVTVPEGANSDNLPSLAQALANTKQDKLTGVEGQVVGFDASGNAQAQEAPDPLPSGGTEGQILTLGADGAEWADAPQINDAIITDANPWSAKKIVDTLAPEFETSGAVVTCTPVAGYPLHVVSQIMPVQGGEGDPSPDNVRPISGWDSATLTHNDTPITIQLGQTVYGGTLDWTTGVLTATWKKIPLLSARKFSIYREIGITIPGLLDYSPAAGTGVGVCSHAPLSKDLNTPGMVYGWGSASLYWIGVLSEIGVTTVTEFQNWLNAQSEEGTPVEVCVQTSEPITIQLTPTEILALSGVNTIYTDTGDTTVSGRADPNAIIQQLATRIAALERQAING